MLKGTVILAHRDTLLAAGMERALYMNHPGVHVERTQTGREALLIQALMRADAVFMEEDLPDMPGIHLLYELKRDIMRPYILFCSKERSQQAERRALRMGVDSYVPAPVDIMRVCDLIGSQLKLRAAGEMNGGLPEAMLQRVFSDNGLPCDLKGYVFLKHALTLLNSGRASLDSMRVLYEQIGERFGCKAGAVEHGIRYAIGLCMQRMGRVENSRLSNRQFIAKLLEESRSSSQTLIKPRVSVFCAGRRVFR